MDLRSDKSFWQGQDGTLHLYPALQQDIDCEVVVIGGGITGALVAHNFSRSGIKTIVVERDQIAHGSTSVSTALLQYEIDTPLYRLQSIIGREKATLAYQLCEDSIGYIAKLAQTLGDNCGFEQKPSLYFALKEDDVTWLHQEYEARKDAGFEVTWLSKDEVQTQYGFSAESAIRSAMGGQIDPYRFTYKLFEELTRNGGNIFERTEVLQIKPVVDGVVLLTNKGYRIHASKVVVAVGYQVGVFLQEETAKLQSTFACVSTPIDPALLWSENCLLWSTDTPYFYARITPDNRIMIGGEDVEYVDDTIRDKFIPIKEKVLVEKFHSLFPQIPYEVDTSWAGTFGETKDGLPYIGISPEYENTYFSLGYGGNGITFSAIAAQLLVDLYEGTYSEALDLFRFGR